MPVVASAGSPTTTVAATAAAIASTCARCLRGTSIRDGALQLCPVLFIMTITPWPTACLERRAVEDDVR